MRDISSILRTLLIATIAVVVIGYAYYKTRDIAKGPIVTITYPANGATFDNSLLEVTGVALNISHITMNDRQIFTDEDGNFREQLLLSAGYNIISIKVRDKFERRIEKTLEIIYNNPKPKEEIINTVVSTSTPSTLEEPIHNNHLESTGDLEIGTSAPLNTSTSTTSEVLSSFVENDTSTQQNIIIDSN